MIITLLSFSTFFIIPMHAMAAQSGRGGSFAVASYCNNMALQRLNTYIDERYAGDYTTASDQYDLLDEHFSACLSHEGYQLNPDYDGDMGYNYMHQ